MRVSVDKHDPGYAPILVGRVKVFVDGHERSGVITADEEARMLVVACVNERGVHQLNNDRTEVKRETVYGHVRIECDPHALALHHKHCAAIRANVAQVARGVGP